MHSCTRLLKRPSHSKYQAGFTIIELMIATAVFSMVLLVITVGVMHFTNDYYKGVNNSTTQTTAQNAIDIISQAIKFSASQPETYLTSGSPYFCIGNQEFVATLGVQYNGGTPSSRNWGLYMFPMTTNTCSSTMQLGGKELLGKGMRLAAVSVSQSDPKLDPTLWKVSLTIAYGDADLLCRTSLGGAATGGCAQNAPAYPSNETVMGSDVQCKSQVGSQFCSVASLSTIVQERIVGG